MSLDKRVRIARRFLRSIRIDTDLGDPRALEGFICPESSAEVLLMMARHFSENKQGAFTWTGPYGSGKSSLIVALSTILRAKPGTGRTGTKVFGRGLSSALSKAFPAGKEGWRVVPVVGRRDDPVEIIGEALKNSGVVQRKPRGGWSEAKLVSAITTAAAERPKRFGGLVIFIDEMGKCLEASAQEGADVYVFQQLAEAAARSNGRLLLVGILHQAFEEYAHRLSHELREEWAKIQGRFVDLVINAAGDEQIDLISRAIEVETRPRSFGKMAKRAAALARRDRPTDAQSLATMLESCWPLHPVVASLLGPMSRRRFGQNQRSIFGFLTSSEPYGFQDFLRRASERDLYEPDRLWDYLRANLEPSILASPDGHRWALAAEAIERCEAIGGDALHLRLLKSIAVVDLFKERSGLIASFDLLRLCAPEISETTLTKVLKQLEKWSFTIYKKFLNSYAVFAGSDFDIDQAVQTALSESDEIDFSVLTDLAGLQPILAKRHYHDTGALRWFDVNFAPVRDLLDAAENYKPQNGTVGQFLLAIPTEGETEEFAELMCRKAARHSERWDIVAGLSKRSWTIVTLAKELVAIENVRNGRAELAGDSVARREVAARLSALQAQLETELHKAFDGATWFRKHHTPKTYRHAELNILASELADCRFDQCPKLHNELLARQRPSSNAVAAQNTLLRRMVLYEGRSRLGIDGFPAEGGLFASILEATGLYTKGPDRWHFAEPQPDDRCRLYPLWQAASGFIKANTDRPIAVSELYDLWRQAPYGVKEGLMPVLAVAYLLSRRDRLAIYRDGIFREEFGDVDVEYLAKDPATIQVRWMDLSETMRRLLSDMAETVRALDDTNSLINLEPIDVARGLVSIYENLPSWAKRTMQLSANAIRVRDVFKRARDPNKFLFDDLPAITGEGGAHQNLQLVAGSIREGLEELVDAYPTMLHRLRDLMIAELQVPNLSSAALAELRERAMNIRQLAGDFHLESFVGRVSQFDGSDEAFEGIASLAANKPPRMWVDPDLDRAAIDIADIAQRFLRAETYARVKGRPEKRHSVAVVIGMNDRPAPILEEFEIADADRAAINDLIAHVAAALQSADTSRRSIILAALAELTARYMQDARDPEANGRVKVAS